MDVSLSLYFTPIYKHYCTHDGHELAFLRGAASGNAFAELYFVSPHLSATAPASASTETFGDLQALCVTRMTFHIAEIDTSRAKSAPGNPINSAAAPAP